MSDARIQALVSGVLDRVRDQLQHELDGMVEGLSAHTADERETAARTARAEAESAAAALASGAIAAERASVEPRLAAARAEAREQAFTEARSNERSAALARAEQLLTSVRSLDDAGSLSEALEALARASALEAGRATVLLVRGEDIKGWAQVGFDVELPDARSLSIPVGEAGLLSEVISSRLPASTSTADGHAGAQPPAPLAFAATDRLGLAAPVIVDSRVVALVYADDASGPERDVPSAWPEHVELLARHASRCLEGLTARQAIRARTEGGAAPQDSGQDPESARRYARLLVSEIKLYHESVVDQGRRSRDLRRRLGSEIARARDLYDARVPPAVRVHGDFFEQELVRTLADGDASLLGQVS
jgi:hypothetical protein